VSDWSSDVCSSDLRHWPLHGRSNRESCRQSDFSASRWKARAAGAGTAPSARTRLGRRSQYSVEYRRTEGRTEAATELLAEFVRLKVDVIHVAGNVYALESERATSVIQASGPSTGVRKPTRCAGCSGRLHIGKMPGE